MGYFNIGVKATRYTSTENVFMDTSLISYTKKKNFQMKFISKEYKTIKTKDNF